MNLKLKKPSILLGTLFVINCTIVTAMVPPRGVKTADIPEPDLKPIAAFPDFAKITDPLPVEIDSTRNEPKILRTAVQLWKKLVGKGQKISDEEAEIKKLYQEHLESITTRYRKMLQEIAPEHEYLLIPSGYDEAFNDNDHEKIFRANPMFRHFVPLHSPNHFVLVSRDEDVPPKLFFHELNTTWIETVRANQFYWSEFWKDNLITSTDSDELLGKVFKQIAGKGTLVSNNYRHWNKRAIPTQFKGIESPDFIYLDQQKNAPLIKSFESLRMQKTDFEIFEALRATESAAKAHMKARTIFSKRKFLSEADLLFKYLGAGKINYLYQHYEAIIAFGENAGILHYLGKAYDREERKSVLIDATGKGHMVADITRSWAKSDVDPLFAELLAGMEELQQEVVALIKPGMLFLPNRDENRVNLDLENNIHTKSFHMIADLLIRHSIIKSEKIKEDPLVFTKVVTAFFMHRIGHYLGLHTHDLSHHFNIDAIPLQPRMMVTIEPGIYFNPGNMKALKALGEEYSQWVDFDKVARLYQYGGIRIEDDILVTERGFLNMTREIMPSKSVLVD